MITDQSSGGAGLADRVLREPTSADATDQLLLERFTHQQDEAAFASLVRRHGPMVLGVCQRILRNPHDAEDAFQATFLVLVRKTSSLTRPELLANWLYGVAYRTALNARTEETRRRARERQLVDMPIGATDEVDWHDLWPVLDEEVNRLPDKYRVPFVLCNLKGMTNEEASRHLGCPKGTVLSRLARARARLRIRLSRRGLAPSAGLIAALLTEKTASATLSAALVDSTAKIAIQFAARRAIATDLVSAKVAALTRGVLRTMLLSKLKTVGMLVLLLGLFPGVVVLIRHRASAVEATAQKAPHALEDADKEQLRGTWYTVAVESHGMKVPTERILAKDVRLVVTGDQWILKEMQGDPDKEFTVRLDPTQNPRAINIVHKTGENKGKTSLGIYELDRSTLRVCLAEPGDPRPTKFHGDGNYTLEIFKREKPRAADSGSGGPI